MVSISVSLNAKLSSLLFHFFAYRAVDTELDPD